MTLGGFPSFLKLAIWPAKLRVVCPGSGAVGNRQGGIFEAVEEAEDKLYKGYEGFVSHNGIRKGVYSRISV